MAQDNVLLRCRGLFTYANSLSEQPEGALSQCDNVVVDREGVISSRRGFKVFGNTLGLAATRAKQLLTYKGRMFRHWGTTLDFDSDGAGTFAALSNTIQEVETGLRIKFIEANGNFYFTTSTGIKKLSATSAAGVATAGITAAGGVKALDGVAALNTLPGFFTGDSAVAYRVVWGIKDANNNIISGTPSEQIIISNPLQDLLITAYNQLCSELATAAAADAGDRLSDVDYLSLQIPTNSLASLLDSKLRDLAAGSTNKLDRDLVVSLTGDITNGSAVVTNIPSTADLVTGMYVTEAGSSIPAATTIISIDSATQVTLSANATATIAAAALTFNEAVFESITPPAVVTDPATTGELTNLSVYMSAIIEALNVHTGISNAALTSIGGAFSYPSESGTVDLSFTAPAGVTTSHFYQVYRSALAQSEGASTISDVSPDDELRLVFEGNPTAAEIAAGTVAFYDNVPEAFRSGGANLYTNANTGEGILQANEQPPLAKDIALFKGHTFFANTKTKHRKQISLLGVTDLVGATLSITKGATTTTFTFDNTEDAATRKIEVSTAATPAQQVNDTARSLVRVINKQLSLGVVAFYVSGPNDVPGMIMLESNVLEDVGFSVNGLDTAAGDLENFNPTLPTTGTTVASDNEAIPNRIYFSKFQQPEAVPILNYRDVGPKDKAVLRILPLRDSLFILSEDGVYRLAGEDANSFSVSLFDSSTQLKATDTAVVLNNQIYMLSSQGVASISDTGISVISRPIEDKLLPLVSPSFTAFSSASFAVPYETDRSYLLWTIESEGDDVATMCYRYNTFTTTWTSWNISKTCGLVNPRTDKLYLGAADTNSIEEERKSFSRLDHADREYAYTIPVNGVSGTTMSLGALFETEANDVFVQTQHLTVAQLNRLLAKLDTDSGTSQDYVATLEMSAGQDMYSVLGALGTKLDADAGLSTATYAAAVSAYASTFANCQLAFNDIVDLLNADAGTRFKNYQHSTGTTEFEVRVASVAGTTITLDQAVPLIAGDVTLFKQIHSFVVWAPHHFGNPAMLKQVSEGTFIFEQMSFTNATAAYSSDLSIGDETISFRGEGSGLWGSFEWGRVAFGGDGTARPFRTYIPQRKQRCRFLKSRFDHSAALEKYALFGISYQYAAVSSRGYR